MTSQSTRGCYIHFRQRVLERIGPDVDAHRLWRRLKVSVERGSDSVTFIARVNKSGRRLWRFYLNDRPFFMIFDHTLRCPITVLPPEGNALCHRDLGFKPINLQAYV